jgi:succinate dehydrogenase / fumarate reductase cytochrome b subunit
LIPDNALAFNQYALFMTTNPAVKLLSYLTYISIIFHAIDGFLLTFQNKKARPIAYAKNSPAANSSFSSRNMAVLGTVILIFIVTHMVTFWAKMHFDKNMPLQTLSVTDGASGNKQDFYITTGTGQTKFLPVNQVDGENLIIEGNKIFITKPVKVEYAEGYKDLYKITLEFFRQAKYGLLYTILYVIAMLALGFHLWHGFASAFQSLGLNNPKFNAGIKFFGKAYSVLVPLLFAIIPLYIHFSK